MSLPYTQAAPGAVGHAVAITKSDATVYNPPLTWLYVGGAGNVAVLLQAQGDDNANAVTLTAPPVGTIITGLAIRKVMSTNTTATLLVGGY